MNDAMRSEIMTVINNHVSILPLNDAERDVLIGVMFDRATDYEMEIGVTPLWKPTAGSPQEIAFHHEADEIFYGGAAGGGKALAVDQIVVTPNGERPIGSLKVGARVCCPDGSISKVIGIFPQGKLLLYRVTFIDGASVLVSGDHLWSYKKSAKQRKSIRVMDFRGRSLQTHQWIGTTDTLKKHIESNSSTSILVPLTCPVPFTQSYRHNPITVSPYALGLLLGDGSLRGNRPKFTSKDTELIWYLQTETGVKWNQDTDIDFRAVGDNSIQLKSRLEKLGLWGKRSYDKFIPQCYQVASIELRFELIRGLMDTNGYADHRGHVEYCTVSKQLALDVQWVLRSLGAKVTITEKQGSYLDADKKRIECRLAYYLYIQIQRPSELFQLLRKKQRCLDNFNGGLGIPMRRITSIESELYDEAVCIKIDHPMGLFLTNDFIVTHNTDLLIGLAITAHRRSVLFRRLSTEYVDAVERSHEILDRTNATYNGTHHIWKGIPGGRALEFGSAQLERDVEKWRGRGHDGLFFDEITGFTEKQYLFLRGWNRTTIPDQRCRIICCGNPPSSAEGEWVIRRWRPWLDERYTHPAQAGEIRWFAMIDGDDTEIENGDSFYHDDDLIEPMSRTFIPALLEDNPYLRDTKYRSTLQSLPEPLRSQVLYGRFDLTIEDNRWQVIPTEWIRQAIQRWEAMEKPEDEKLSALGVDCARGGDAQTIIAPRWGTFIGKLVKLAGVETTDGWAIFDEVNAFLTLTVGTKNDAHKEIVVNIDMLGTAGSSPYDTLMREGFEVVGIISNEGSIESDKSGKLEFYNKRAELWWKMREMLDPRDGEDIALPPDSELLADLSAPTWKPTPRGILIEDKESIFKRLGRSTDCGDAVVYSFDHTSAFDYVGFLN